jgi:hypothetical protein
MTLDFEDIFKCKDITPSTLKLYETKLRLLNDNKPIKNVNYLYDINNIKSKIEDFKPNTRRSYIISIVSILKCLTMPDKKPIKKLIKLFNDYSKIMDEYNINLKDQTTITEGTQVLTPEEIENVYKEVKEKALNKKSSKQQQQDYLILSLYTLTPPRRNKDYIYMKVIKNYNDELSYEYNYYDGSKFYFNNYKTNKKYKQQIVDVPNELQTIINNYIKDQKINDNDFLLTNGNNEDLTTHTNIMTNILNRIFKSKVGSSMLRRSFLTNKYGNTKNELNNDTIAMGTSLGTANSNYIKKT